jgi:intracellular sulfur oxidation DsrE/DsrF family protein
MNRRNIFAIFGAAAALAPFGVRKAAAEGDKKPHRLAIHVDQNEPGVMKLALNNTMNMYEHYRERGEEVVVEIVAYSQGLHMLREDTSPVKERIKNFAASMPNVRFAACKNTMYSMEKKEGRPIAILPNASVVIAGVTRLIELSEDGWTIVRP